VFFKKIKLFLKIYQKIFAVLKNRRIFAPKFLTKDKKIQSKSLKNNRMVHRTTNISTLSIINVQDLDVNGYFLEREREREREREPAWCPSRVIYGKIN
jgi:hypothetical protein